MVKKSLMILMLSMAVTFGICSCGKPGMTTSDEPPISIALTQDLLSFDPMMTSDIFSEAVLRCVYTSLFDFDENLQLRKKLAKEVLVVDDTTWEIKIHENVRFQNGSPLTVDDVIFSIERGRQGGRTQKLYEVIDSVEKVDDTTFLIRTKNPYSDFLTVFAKAETSIVSKEVVEEESYDFSIPVGAGPFSLASREEGKNICLQRFDDYYLEKAASPYLNFEVLITEQERTAAFLNGEVDILFSVSAYDCEKLKLSPNVKLLQKQSSKIEYLSLNNHHPPLDNPTVRRAISYAINRDNITSGVYNGYSTPNVSLIPKGIIGYQEPEISYDKEKARALLKEAGYEDGFAFTVITIDSIRKNTMEYIKLDLAEVGIELNYQLVTMKEAADLMTNGKHESILVGWAFNADPNSVLPLLLGSGSGKTMNSSNYSNPVVDSLIADGREETDLQKKEQIYQKINQTVTEEAPIVVLQTPMVLSAQLDTIEGVHFNAQGLFQYESLYRKK